METAVLMAVRKLGYTEGFVRVNWETIRLCYEEATRVSAMIVCAYIRNTYCACNFHILHVTPDVKIHPRSQENPSNVTRSSSLPLRGVSSGDETNYPEDVEYASRITLRYFKGSLNLFLEDGRCSEVGRFSGGPLWGGSTVSQRRLEVT